MKTRLSHITVVMIATIGLLGSAARADLISIDFDLPTTLPTQSGLNTDANGQTSLLGQVGSWNSLSMPGTGAYNTGITATLTSGTLKNGAGVDTSVSFAFNTGNIATWNAYKTSTTPAVQRDFLGCVAYTFPEWNLSGLEPNTLYRLRMFGREDANVPTGFASFSAMGMGTTNRASTNAKRNQADLWAISSAVGTISGTLGGYSTGGAGAWSGMQIEWNVEIPAPPVISIDFGYGSNWPGPVASYQQVDMNGDQSLLGQNGPWNEFLTGDNAGGGTTWNATTDTPQIAGLLDGDGNATTVAFAFNTGSISYTTFSLAPAQPKQTALHRDCVYVDGADWLISGLTPSTEYTLKLFGLQTGDPTLFGAFTATGINTDSGSASLTQNYVDLVVTSTVSGEITGTLNKTTATVGSFSGIQIQSSGGAPFLDASSLISLDFETAATGSKTPTASGLITDSLGGSSWAQDGVWNSMISGSTTGSNWQATSMQPIINNMFDGAGNATAVDFKFNTGTPLS